MTSKFVPSGMAILIFTMSTGIVRAQANTALGESQEEIESIPVATPTPTPVETPAPTPVGSPSTTPVEAPVPIAEPGGIACGGLEPAPTPEPVITVTREAPGALGPPPVAGSVPEDIVVRGSHMMDLALLGTNMPGPARTTATTNEDHGWIARAFDRVEDLEAALGGKGMPRPKPIIDRGTGKPVVVSIDRGWFASIPKVPIEFDGKAHQVPVDLYGLDKKSKEVALASNGRAAFALDRRTGDVWKLHAENGLFGPSFRWIGQSRR